MGVPWNPSIGSHWLLWVLVRLGRGFCLLLLQVWTPVAPNGSGKPGAGGVAPWRSTYPTAWGCAHGGAAAGAGAVAPAGPGAVAPAGPVAAFAVAAFAAGTVLGGMAGKGCQS